MPSPASALAHPAAPVRAGHLSPRKIALLAAAALCFSACHAAAPHAATASGPAAMQLTSDSFARGGLIPQAFTCDGQNRSPQLAWSRPPNGTRTLALTVTDPDAPSGTFTHWVLFNLPAAARSLPEGLNTAPQLPNGALQGSNSFGRIGYGGPCPPPGSTHRYIFTLYALDRPLALDPGVTRDQLEAALAGHSLAVGRLSARYGR